MNKPARIVAAAAAAALLLTGCSAPPSAASVVGGERISDREVRDAGTAIATVTGADAATSVRQAAFDLTLGEASRQISVRTGVAVSDAARQSVIDADPAFRQVADLPEGAAWAAARSSTYALVEQMGNDRFVQELSKTPITFNPRYGAWDAQQLGLTSSALSTAVQTQR